MKNQYILLIETATSTCSAAVALNGKVVAVEEKEERNIHAGSLTLFIDEVIRRSGIRYSDLAAVAVSMGPGSYTGLRIGVSAAKGLCFALDIPLIAISSLDSLAFGLLEQLRPGPDSILIPMIDARRMEVYLKCLNSSLETLQDVEAKIIDENSFDEFKPNEVLLFGDGAAKFEGLFGADANVSFPKVAASAKYMAEPADQKLRGSKFENMAYFEPYYLKEFIANKPKKSS